MKIILDLKHSYNNYHWKDKRELEIHIAVLKGILWQWYKEKFIDNWEEEKSKLFEEETIKNSLYDILDMFNRFEIKESDLK